MSTWTRRGEGTDGAWANRVFWKRRRYWRRASAAEFLAARAIEQADLRRRFIVDSAIPQEQHRREASPR